MTLGTATITGILYRPDGSPFASSVVELQLLSHGVDGIADGGRVPSQVSAVTDATGAIGTDDGVFVPGIDLSLGRYVLSVPGAPHGYRAVVTVDQNMIDAGVADLEVTLQPAPPPVIVSDAQLARDAAVAAAEATAADRLQTGLDAEATAADRVQTGLDATATAADRVQTGLDAEATAADRVQTGLDAEATAADRVQTGLDAEATAADRVQTGLDADAAVAARDKANAWAENPENVEVDPGQFSALHHAAKANADRIAAEASATAAQGVEFAQQDYLISAGALHSQALVTPSPATMTLDFGRRAFGRSEGGAVSEVGISSDYLTLTRASTATYMDADGTLQTAAVDEARTANHIWQDGMWKRRFLVEPQATNLVLHSEDLSLSPWQTSSSPDTIVTAGDGDGFTNIAFTAPSTNRIAPREQVINGAAGVLVISALFRPGAGTETIALAAYSATGKFVLAAYNIPSGTWTTYSLSSPGVMVGLAATEIRPGVWKLVVEFTSDTITAVMAHFGQGTASDLRFNSPVASCDIGFVQAEANLATSYIKTEASQVTRAADVASIAAGVWPFAAGGLSVAVKGELTYRDSGAEYQIYIAGTGVDYVNAVVSTVGSRVGTLKAAQRIYNVYFSNVELSGFAYTPGVEVPVSISTRHTPTDLAISADGIPTTSTATDGLPDLSAYSFRLGGGAPVNYESLRIWSRPLNNTQLEEASA